MGLSYFILDCETNGVDSKIHEINEISIIRYENRLQLTEFIKCEHPERSSYDALKITNKTIQDILTGKSKEDAVTRIDKFINEDGLSPAHRCFVAHNASFDRRFLHALYDKVGKRCSVDLWLCTMELTRDYIKKTGQKSPVNLKAACDFTGVKRIEGAHASKVDTRNTYLLLKNLIDEKKVDYIPFIKSFPHKNDDDIVEDFPSLEDIE